jgi:hypothetical protein
MIQIQALDFKTLQSKLIGLNKGLEIKQLQLISRELWEFTVTRALLGENLDLLDS